MPELSGDEDSNERADGDGRSEGHAAVPATGYEERQSDESAGECRDAQEGDKAAETRPAGDGRHQFRVPGAEPSDPSESKADDENDATAGKVPGDIPVAAKHGDEGRGGGDRQYDGIGDPLPAQVLNSRNRDEDHRHKGDVNQPLPSPCSTHDG